VAALYGVPGVQKAPRVKKPKMVGPQTLAAQGSRGGGLQPAFRAASPNLSTQTGNTAQAFANTQSALATSAQTGAQRSAPTQATWSLVGGSGATPAAPPATPIAPGAFAPPGYAGVQPVNPPPLGYPAGGAGLAKPVLPTQPVAVVAPGGATPGQPSGGGAVAPSGPTAPASPAAATPDAGALFDSDPRTMALMAWIAQQRGALSAQYGLIPRIVNGQQAKDANGNPIYDWAASNDAPYSVYNTLTNQFGQQLQNVQNNANASGALFSGATAAGGSRAEQAYNRNLYDAMNTFLTTNAGFDKQRADLFSQLYPELAKRASDLADAAKPRTPASSSGLPATPPPHAGMSGSGGRGGSVSPPQGRPASKPNPNGDQTKPVDKRPAKPSLSKPPKKRRPARGTNTMGRGERGFRSPRPVTIG